MRLLMAAVLLLDLFPARAAAAALEQRGGVPVRVMSLPAGLPLGVPILPVSSLTSPAGLGSLPSLAALPSAAAPVMPAAAQPALPQAPGLPAAHVDPAAPSAHAQLAALGRALAPAGEGRGGGSAAPGPGASLNAAFDGSAPGAAEDASAPQAGSSAPQPPLPPSAPGPRRSWRAAVPNLITGLNLTSGLGAALLASQGSLLPAAGLILLGNVFDALDGRAARLLGVSSPIGAELDSLADVVTFGVAPALLIFKAALAPLGVWGFAAAAAFAGAGAFRLARFNLGAYAEREGKAPKAKSDSFTGLPIPGGAGVIVALTLLLPALHGMAAAATAVGVTLLTAAAMASRLPYPAFKKSGKALLAAAAASAAVSLPLLALGHALFIPAAVFGLYLATGPAVWAHQGSSDAFRKELKRKAFHQLALLYVPGLMLAGAHAAPLLVGWTALVGAIDLVRLRARWARPFFERWFGGIIREKEQARMSGTFYVALGVTAAGLLFGPTSVAVYAAVAALALGDAISPLVGLRFGWKPYTALGTQRSLDGTLAGFATAYAIALAAGCGPVAALAAAAAFSVVDTLPVKPDDNFWIPVVFAAALHFLR